MKPTSEMTEQEAACFVNLKKAVNESFLVLDYLEQAKNLSDVDTEPYVSTCVRMIEDTIFDIKEAIAYLTK